MEPTTTIDIRTIPPKGDDGTSIEALSYQIKPALPTLAPTVLANVNPGCNLAAMLLVWTVPGKAKKPVLYSARKTIYEMPRKLNPKSTLFQGSPRSTALSS
jgi:hypothetical protein